jgi:PAS domain S-box-containing protein
MATITVHSTGSMLKFLLVVLVGGFILLFGQDFVFHQYLNGIEQRIANEQVRIRLGAYIEYELKTLRACLDEVIPAINVHTRELLLQRVKKARENIAHTLDVVEQGGELDLAHRSVADKNDIVEHLVYHPRNQSRYLEEILALRALLTEVEDHGRQLRSLMDRRENMTMQRQLKKPFITEINTFYARLVPSLDRMEEYAEKIYANAASILLQVEAKKRRKERIFIFWTLITGFGISATTIVLATLVAKRITCIQKQQDEQQQRFRTVADQSYAWEYWIRTNREFEYISPACKRISGYTAEEFQQEPDLISSIVHPEDRELFTDHLTRLDKGPSHLRFRILTKSGRERWIQHICRPVYDDAGQFQGRRASNIDCTEQYIAEERIRLSKQEWVRTFDAIPDLIMLLDRDYRIIKANQATADTFGLSIEECLGRRCFQEFHNSNHPLEHCPLTQLFIDGKRHEKELQVGDKYFNVSVSPIYNQDKITGAVHVGRDITRQHQAEQIVQDMLDTLETRVSERTVELQKAYSDLEQIFEVSLPLVVVNKDCVIERVNKAFCRFFKVRKKHILGHKCHGVWHGDFCETDECTMKQLKSGVPYVTRYFDGVLPHGLAVTCSIRSGPYQDAAGNFSGQITSFFDLSERKQAELELEKARQQLLHAEKLNAIGSLSASIAHEFNNPLCGVLNVLDRLQRKAALDTVDREMVALALSEGERMKRLIMDLQNFNRPSSGKVSRFDLHQAMDDMILLLKKELKVHGIQLTKNYYEGLILIEAIEDQIKQVMLNILKNAVEATAEVDGSITLQTLLFDREVQIHIANTGSVIAPNDLPHIFEPFFTTKSAVTGTGLGLSVTYGIVKAHGGEIMVQSGEKEGTVFTVTLPLSFPLNKENGI